MTKQNNKKETKNDVIKITDKKETTKQSLEHMYDDDTIISALKKMVQLNRINQNQYNLLIESDYMRKTNQCIKSFKEFIKYGDLNKSYYISIYEEIRDFINRNIKVSNKSYDEYKLNVFIQFEQVISDYGIKYDTAKIYKEHVLPEIKKYDKISIDTDNYEYTRRQLQSINSGTSNSKLLYCSNDIDSVNNLYIILQYSAVGPTILIYSPTLDIKNKYKRAYKKLILDM